MDNTLVVFTYAPAGLGHIRVTDALISGIPEGTKYSIFSPEDTATELAHRFSSINTFARRIMEISQKGLVESVYKKFYTSFLTKNSKSIALQFLNLKELKKSSFKKIVIVSTHFGLAIQLGEAKKFIEEKTNAKVFLVVQVTDDSPQKLWMVEKADLILCPSHNTRNTLLSYNLAFPKDKILVTPYPVSLEFKKLLNKEEIEQRKEQYNPKSNIPINVAIPVSGAAVGTEFFLHLINGLKEKSSRYIFHVICRKAPFTLNFINKIKGKDYVKLYISESFREIVTMYKDVYEKEVIGCEITKPSEQSFKALISPYSIGGSYLFLAEPVGRQEYDNLDFLTRHGFLGDIIGARCKLLPFGSKASCEYINDLFKSGKILQDFENPLNEYDHGEIGDFGVEEFWKVVIREFFVKD